MPNNGYFDIKRDTEIIGASGFFCRACVVGKPVAEISPDPRYCQGCYTLLLEEAEMITGQPRWVPNQSCKATQSKLSPLKEVKVSPYPNENMSTLEGEKIVVDNLEVRGRPKTYKKIELPEGKIRKMAGEGMGAKAIATQLKREYGIGVSYKTIQRLLSGERGFEQQ